MEAGDKKFPCATCPSAFKRAEHLTRHTRIHSKAKPYPCDACPKAFSRSDSLKRHYAGHDSVSWQDYKRKLDSLVEDSNSCFWAEYNAGRLSAYQLKTHIHSAACAVPPKASASSSSSSTSGSTLSPITGPTTDGTTRTSDNSLRLLAETCFSALGESSVGPRTDSSSSSSQQQAAKKIRIEDLLNK